TLPYSHRHVTNPGTDRSERSGSDWPDRVPSGPALPSDRVPSGPALPSDRAPAAGGPSGRGPLRPGPPDRSDPTGQTSPLSVSHSVAISAELAWSSVLRRFSSTRSSAESWSVTAVIAASAASSTF